MNETGRKLLFSGENRRFSFFVRMLVRLNEYHILLGGSCEWLDCKRKTR